MDHNYWKNKWVAGDIGFHKLEPNVHLKNYYPKMKPGSVFVPLCGKSRDVDWLAQQGRTVIGAELSPLACESFFGETGRPFEKKEEHGFTVYRSPAITLWCGDFFKLPTEATEEAQNVYDRAALVALPEALRINYSSKITDLVPKLTSMLLISIEYQQGSVEGPPFSVPEFEIKGLYSQLKFEMLHKSEDANPSEKLRGVKVTEKVWLAQR